MKIVVALLLALLPGAALAQQPTPEAQALQQAVALRIGQLELENAQLVTQVQQLRAELSKQAEQKQGPKK